MIERLQDELRAAWDRCDHLVEENRRLRAAVRKYRAKDRGNGIRRRAFEGSLLVERVEHGRRELAK